MKNYFASFFTKNKYSSKYLLSYILSSTDSEFLIIFKHTNDKIETYLIFGNSNRDGEYFKIKNEIGDGVVINTPQKSPYIYDVNDNVKNCVLVPVFWENSSKYYISLVNKKDGYNVEIINSITEISMFFNIFINSECRILKMEHMFLERLSNRIKKPLCRIINYNNLMFKTDIKNKQISYLRSMNECNIELMSIINDIFDFASLKSGNVRVYKECFILSDIKKIISSTIKDVLKQQEKMIRFKLSPKLPVCVKIDKSKFIQILINIVTKSITLMKENDTVYISVDVENKDCLLVNVKDNGYGMKPGELKHLFDCVYLEETPKLVPDILDLRMYITKSLVNILGGTINVTSTPGYGSCFTLRIPFKMYEHSLDHKTSAYKGMNILIVDDDVDNRIMLCKHLYELETNPYICTSSLEAMKILLSKRYQFDMALIDVLTPSINGNELAYQIKLELPNLPIISLSSPDNIDEKRPYFISSIDKPVDKLILINKMGKVLLENHN